MNTQSKKSSNEQNDSFRRINVLITQDQYSQVTQAGLNMSGLLRGLLDDHFSDEKIVFSMSPSVKDLYQRVVSNFGAGDADLEPYFLRALDDLLADKVRQIEALRKRIKT
jgi:esterase/lipase